MTLLDIFHYQGRGQPIGGAATQTYQEKVLTIQPSNLILYHPMNELTGSTATDQSAEGNDGSYTGVTLANILGPDGVNYAPFFDGANDFNDFYSAGFNSDYSGTEGTMAIWCKVTNSGVWTDGENRRGMFFGNTGYTNIVSLAKSGNNNEFTFVYKAANGDTVSVTKSSLTTTAWFHVAITWSDSGNVVKAYYNGTQEGSDQAMTDTWNGTLNSDYCNIGCRNNDVPDKMWDGYLAHGAIWKTALTDAEIATLADT